ncbi:MAG: hypothetical protein GAK43_00777 [Stenotrophomonas maltophilia]|nr:MAG: hypothetical protein GAK43_00777 [Stenotrophomonas maltophilia]
MNDDDYVHEPEHDYLLDNDDAELDELFTEVDATGLLDEPEDDGIAEWEEADSLWDE